MAWINESRLFARLLRSPRYRRTGGAALRDAWSRVLMRRVGCEF